MLSHLCQSPIADQPSAAQPSASQQQSSSALPQTSLPSHMNSPSHPPSQPPKPSSQQLASTQDPQVTVFEQDMPQETYDDYVGPMATQSPAQPPVVIAQPHTRTQAQVPATS